MNIRIYNHYAVTPNFPGGTRHYDLASELAAFGHSVTVFASGFNYSQFKETQVYKSKTFVTEKINKVNWCWIKTTPYTSNDGKRLSNMMSYSRAIKKISSKFPKPDLVIGSTVHPFAALAASKIAKKTKAMFIYEIRDLWPQTLIDNRTWDPYHPAAFLFRKIESITVSRANGFIVLSPKTKDYLTGRYNILENLINHTPNSCRQKDFSISKTQAANNPLSFMYLGGVDSVHKLDDLFLALQKPEIRKLNIKFSLVGGGKEKENLITHSQNKSLDMIAWKEPVIKSRVPEKLSTADFLFLPMSEVFYGSENKLSEYMMAGKPILSYTPAEHNDPAKLANCGISSPYGDIDKLAENIIKMVDLTENERLNMGMEGRKYAIENLDISKLGQQLNSFLNSL